jgi:hypothetical protein
MDHVIEKLGFESNKNRIDREYGHHHTVELSDRTLTVKSDAEEWFARVLDVMKQSGAVLEWAYEPEVFSIDYKYHKCACGNTYTPDFRVKWNPATSKDGTQYFEVKRGKLEAKYGSKIRRFCQQHETKSLVLVWYGRLPKKGATKARLDKITPHLHHIWNIIKTK